MSSKALLSELTKTAQKIVTKGYREHAIRRVNIQFNAIANEQDKIEYATQELALMKRIVALDQTYHGLKTVAE